MLQVVRSLGKVLNSMKVAVCIFGSSSYALSKAPVELRKDLPFNQSNTRFAVVEFNHNTQTTYDQSRNLLSQTPSLETIGRGGVRLYRGAFETFIEGGIVKFASTQQMLQKRPLVGINYFPWADQLAEVRLYSVAELPHADESSKGELDEDASDPTKQGSILTVGTSGLIDIESDALSGPLGWRVGYDLWTKMYSRKQVITPSSHEDAESMRLAQKIAESAPIEDQHLSYDTQFKTGFYWSMDFKRDTLAELLLIYDNHHYPAYFVDQDDQINHETKVQRTSRLRARLSWKISDHIVIRNDFYKNYLGLYKAHSLDPLPGLTNILQMGYYF